MWWWMSGGRNNATSPAETSAYIAYPLTVTRANATIY
jgi:hypothetical protein